nr:MAG TPA: hypothetical protein [Caudoviricetes sp.]
MIHSNRRRKEMELFRRAKNSEGAATKRRGNAVRGSVK